MTLLHQDGKWVPSTKFVAPYLLAVASNSPLPDLLDYVTLADPAIELVKALPGLLARAIGEENQLRDQLTAKDEELETQARLMKSRCGPSNAPVNEPHERTVASVGSSRRFRRPNAPN